MSLTSGVSDVHSLSPSEQSISMPQSPRGWRLPWQAARSPPVRLKLGVMTQVHRRTMPVQHREQPPPGEGPLPPPRPLPLGFLSLQTGCADSRTTYMQMASEGTDSASSPKPDVSGYGQAAPGLAEQMQKQVPVLPSPAGGHSATPMLWRQSAELL